MRKSEAKFRAIYDEAEIGIALIGADGMFVDANPAMLRMLGRNPEQIVGHSVWEFASGSSAALVRSLFEREDAAGGQWREIFSLGVPDSDDVYLEWTMSQQIEPGLRVGVVNNISARMQFQEQRESLLNREKAARIIAEQHSQTKDDFIAILSHELRNPLNAILMAADVLLARSGSPELAVHLRMIQRNAKTQARIIADILDMARINSGKMTLERGLMDPAELITASLEGMKPLTDNLKLEVSVEMDGAHGLVELDATRFQQIFWNIFNNAIKFSEPGGSIEVTLKQSDGLLSLRVRDYGKGIDSEFLKKIFDKFSQGATPGNRSHGGLGLGMSIVHHLTHLHGGTVRVESNGIGQGAEVIVDIPIKWMPRETDTLFAVQENRGFELDLANLVILVVEDEPQNREMITLVLKDRGALVSTAENYEEALESISNTPPDLIISDIGLPGRDGYELMLEIRDRERVAPSMRTLPAIALTAFARPEDVARARQVGFDAHLAKPLNALDLVELSSSLVKRAQKN